MKLLSLQEKIKKLAQLTATDCTAWEADFIGTIKRKADAAIAAGQVTAFSDPQIEKIDQIYGRHFA